MDPCRNYFGPTQSFFVFLLRLKGNRTCNRTSARTCNRLTHPASCPSLCGPWPHRFTNLRTATHSHSLTQLWAPPSFGYPAFGPSLGPTGPMASQSHRLTVSQHRLPLISISEARCKNPGCLEQQMRVAVAIPASKCHRRHFGSRFKFGPALEQSFLDSAIALFFCRLCDICLVLPLQWRAPQCLDLV